jgi:integrase
LSARYASSVASNSEGSTWCKISRWTSIWFIAGTTTGENVKSEPATVHRVLSMIMAYAMKDGRLAVNPAAGVSLPRVREPEKRYLTERPVAELADAVGEEYRLIVLFLAYTGLR